MTKQNEQSKTQLAQLPQKDLSIYRSQTSQVLDRANALTISSEKDVEMGADVLHTLKEVETAISSRKEEITRPLMASLSSARELFKPLELSLDNAKKTIKGKMLAFQIAEEERIEKEKERIAGRVEKGTMRRDTAIAKMEGLGDVPTSASGSVGRVMTRNLTKVRIVDEALIPRMYLVPDMTKITTAIIQGGVDVPGCEKYTEKTIVGK